MASLDNRIEALQQRLTALRQSAAEAGQAQTVLQDAIDDLQHIHEAVNAERADRQRIEQALRERESLLRIYVEHTPSAVAIFDREMRYLLISQRWLYDYRLGEQDVIGRSHYEIFPEIPERWKAIHRRCLNGAVERCDADPFPRLDGAVDWVRWEIHPWYTGDGTIGGIIVFSEVITGQVEAQKALRESEFSLKRSQAIAHVGHWTWDTQINTVAWSDEMYRIFGIDREAFTGNLDEVINAAIHPDDKARVLQSNAAVINEQRPEILEYRVVWSDGSVRHVSAQPGESLCDSAGNIVRLSGIVQDITERKQAEQALRDSETRFRALIEQAPIAIAMSRDLKFVYANPKFLEMYGFSTIDELIGQPIVERVAPEHRAEFEARAKRREQNLPAEIKYETVAARKDGSTFYILASVSRVALADGPATLGFFQNISERKQAELALQASERKLRRFIEQSPTGVVLTDETGHVVEWNDSQERITGMKRADVLGKYLWDIQHQCLPEAQRTAEAYREIKNKFQEFLRTGVLTWPFNRAEIEIQRPDGSAAIIHSVVSAIQAESGYVAAGLISDLTEQKRAEQALRESEARLRLIVENSPDHIFYQDCTLRYIWSAKPPQGVGIQGMLGKTDFDLFGKAEAERLAAIKRRVLQTGIGEHTEGHLNLMGRDYYYEAFYEPRRETSGQIIGLVAYVRDISERKRAEIAEREQRILSEALRDTTASLTSTLDSETVMDRILDNIGRVIPCDAVNILIIEGDICRLRYWRGANRVHKAACERHNIPLNAPDLQQMLRTDRPILIPDTTVFPGWVNPLVRSHVAVPLRVQNQVIGFLNLDSYQPSFFDESHAGKLQIFADQAAVAIQNAHLYGQLSDHAAELEVRVRQRTVELLQAKEHVEAVLNSSSDGIILVNRETGVQQTNPAFNALFACAPNDYQHVPLEALVAAESVLLVQHAFDTTIMRGTINRLEVRARRKDGTTFDAEIGLSPVTDGGAVLSTAVCILHDVTERKQAQQALAEERNLLRSLIDTIPDYIYVKDTQHRLVLYNAACRLFDDDARRGIGKTDVDFLPPDMATNFRAKEEAVLAGEALIDQEEQTLNEQDNPIWVSTTKAPLRNINGEIVGLVGISRDITTRKRDEAALRVSEERWREAQQMLRTILDTIPVRVFWKDRNSVYLGCNRLFAQDIGLESPEDVVGKSAFDLPIFAGYAADYVAHDRAVLQTGTPHLRYEQSLPTVDGKDLWALTSKVPLRDSQGNITGVLGMYIDITERKQAEEMRQRYAAEVEDLYNNAPCGYHSLDENGIFVRINDTALRWLGYTREEVVGKLHITDLLTSRGVQAFQTSFPQFKVRGWVNDREYELVRKDGSRLTVLLSSTAIYDEQGQYVMDRATYFDITALQQAQVALQESEARFRGYFELPLVGMAVTSPEKDWLQVNDKLCEMLGYSRDELVQKSWVELTHPDDAVLDLEQFEQVLAGQFDDYSLDKRYYRKDGQIIYASITTRAVRDINRQISYFVTLVQDITARKHLEDELRRALDREKELNELKTRFVSLVSHEFRTPLSSIQLASELLQRYHHKMTDDQRIARMVGIQTEVRHMVRLLNDVLTISRIERGKLVFNPAPLDVVVCCQDLVETAQAVTDTHRFVFTATGDCPIHNADSELLQHILTNLINNAVKYSPVGKSIYLNVDCQAEQVMFKVRDEGIGIPIVDQLHIFESFYRAGNIGQIGGTGLGLAIVKQMVERHGGDVTFESEVGIGTTFTVTIPTNIPAGQDHEKPAPY
ncbi:MAG: PAS domain S-box protein [Anaerolineae bacterium]|nr:PAS domain S-box protein [Anaerolineae bacterium]